MIAAGQDGKKIAKQRGTTLLPQRGDPGGGSALPCAKQAGSGKESNQAREEGRRREAAWIHYSTFVLVFKRGIDVRR
jgi:hypothetical protein